MLRPEDISKPGQLAEVRPEDLMPLPAPYDSVDKLPPFKVLNDQVRAKIDLSLDGFSALGISRPQTPEEEKALVEKFISGLRKLLTKENNWTFLEQLTLSL
jgi:hypothetical protein